MTSDSGETGPERTGQLHLASLWLGIVVVDEHDIVTARNAALVEALGDDAPEVGRPAPTSAPWWVEAVANQDRDPRIVRANAVRHVLADGTLRWLRVQALRPATGDGRVVVVEDVTAEEDGRRELEGAAAVRSHLVAELDDANAQLARTNAELRRFAGAIAHDLKGPLANMLGFIRLLPEVVDDVGDEGAEVIRRLERNAERSSEMVSDLLAYARTAGSPSDHETVDLQAAVEWAVDVKRVDLDRASGVVIVGELPSVLGNEAALRQVFLNLVDNAVKYRRPDVPLTLEFRQVPSSDPDLAEILVVDNGRGIPRELRSQIFDLGVRGDPDAVAGSGIGLASCAAVLRSFGGYITVGPIDDGAGAGATFVVGIPRAEVLDDTLMPLDGSVMVIDDDADVVQIVRLLATSVGLGVVADAGSAAEAIAVYDALRPPPDIVVLDLALPDGSGLDVARELLRRDRDLRILVHSGLVDEAMVEAALDIGVTEVVGKAGGDDDDFVAALRRLAMQG